MASRKHRDIRKRARAGSYLPPWRCLFSDLKRRRRARQGRTGPAGPPSGCRTDPRSRFGSSLAPSTLQHQLYSDPPLSRGVRRGRRRAAPTLRGPARVIVRLPGRTPGGRICTDSSADTWHCGSPGIPEQALLRTREYWPTRGAARCPACLASPNKRQLSAMGCHVGPKDWSWRTPLLVCVYCPVRCSVRVE